MISPSIIDGSAEDRNKSERAFNTPQNTQKTNI